MRALMPQTMRLHSDTTAGQVTSRSIQHEKRFRINNTRRKMENLKDHMIFEL